jgi:hypothetical protein
MSTPNGVPNPTEVSTLDAQWAAWVATGVEDDRQARTWAIVAFGVLLVLMGSWLTVVFLAR